MLYETPQPSPRFAGSGASLSGMYAVGIVAALLTAWIVAIFLVPPIRFDLRWDVRVPLETTGAVVACITAGLAYIWYSFTGARSTFYLALAFVVLGMNQLVFGLVVARSGEVQGQQGLYFWTAGRLVAAGLLMVGLRSSRTDPRESRVSPAHPLRAFTFASAVVLAGLTGTQVLVWAARGHLPPLTATSGLEISTVTGAVEHLTVADVLLGAVTASLYLVAAVLAVRRPPEGIEGWWLPVALAVAGFAHLHYIFFPTVVTDRISTADLIRVGFAGALFFGLLWQVRNLQERERDQRLELERLSRAKAELSYILTHDLMHEIATLRNYGAHLVRRWDTLAEDDRRKLAERLERGSARLRDLADRTLTTMDPDEAVLPIQRRPVPVRDLVRDVLDATDWTQQRLHVQTDGSADTSRVVVDPVRIRQVFVNLLSNAEKYSPPGSPIDLRIRRSDGEIDFVIADEGPEIPPEQMAHLFEPFARGSDGAHAPGGWGVGLFISRKIVEAHGGRIWAESEPNGGSCFCFSLPVSADE